MYFAEKIGGKMNAWWVIVVIAGLWYMTKDASKAKKEAAERQREAVFLDCDMSSKFRELLDDPAMTEAKWREWLPVFDFADAEVRRKAPDLPIGEQGYFIRQMIAGRDQIDLQ